MGLKVLKKIALFLIAPLCFNSCQMFLGKDDVLKLTRKINESEKLRLDGYYYVQGNNMVDVYFVFQNGALLNVGGFKKDEWNDFEKSIIKESVRNEVLSQKYSWGVYQILKDSIQFERWYPTERPYRTSIRKGVILNDTTFVITETVSSKNVKSLKNEVYHFKEFSPKMDSVTKYID